MAYNTAGIIGPYMRNALVATTFDISGGNISNSGTTTSANVTISGRLQTPGTLDISGGNIFVTGSITAGSIASSAIEPTNIVVPGYIRNSIIPSSLDISGGNISNSGTTTSANFIGASGSSNSIGGVTFENSNITNDVGSSNYIGGVTLSGYTISTSNNTSNTIGGVTLSNSAITTSFNVSNTIGGVTLQSGNISNDVTSSNTIGGVTLSNSAITNDVTSSNTIGGVTLSNSAITTSVNVSNTIGGVTLSNNNVTLAGTITGSTANTSNRIGGVTLSNSLVGIGTSAPLYPLDISSSGTAQRVILSSTTSAAAMLMLQPNLTGGNQAYRVFGVSEMGCNAVQELFTYVGSGNASNSWQIRFVGGGSDNGIRLVANGNVGIGISNPGYRLDVTGTTQTTNALVPGYLRNNLTATQFDISGGNISNSATHTSSNFIGTATASNNIGGVTLQSNNLTLAGTITGSTATASNNIGGVTLSNTNLALVGTITGTNPAVFNNIGGVSLWNQRVGIGRVANNGAILDISGGAASSCRISSFGQASILLIGNGSQDDVCGISMIQNASVQGIYSSNLLPFHIYTSGSQRLTVLPGGNVGIGNPSPNYPLSFSNTTGTKISMFESSGGVLGFGVFASEFRTSADAAATATTWGHYTGATFTERMRLVNSNGNLGIGAAVLSNYRMTIKGTGTNTGTIAFHKNATDVPYVGMGYDQTVDASDGLAFFTNSGAADLNGTAMFIMRTNRRVGIGTTVPTELLDVVGGSIQTNAQLMFNSPDTEKIYLTNFDTSGSKITHSAGWSVDIHGGTNTAASGNIRMIRGIVGGFAETARFDSNGRLGINNVAPSHTLDVGGTIRGSSNIVAVFTTTNAGGTYTTGPVDILSFTYTPKQTGSPRIVIRAHFEASYPGGGGNESASVVLTDSANTELLALVIGVDGNNSMSRGSRLSTFMYHTTISGATTYKLRANEGGDDPLTVSRIYIVVEEISTV